MKLDKLVGERFKEKPSDCVIESHALMMRGGYMKDVAKGIYSQFTPLKRICQKIEGIIREEMDAIDGQEVLFPVALPASLWDESGRYESVGSELLRFTDRNGSKMVLGMTHEEAAVQLVRDYAKSYNSYPFMIYQIQTKFRDEARPRAGLIRVREFTMKDAYSFDSSNEGLDVSYQKMFDAYHKIFKEVGLKYTVVRADTGAMGGLLSEEFQALTDVGEDVLVICENCGYSSNIEVSECVENKIETKERKLPKEKVYTPNAGTIKEVSDFLGEDPSKFVKTLIYKVDNDFKVVLGLDEYDKLVTFDFDKEKSLLVTGVSGTGKTNLFNDIIMNILINYSNVKVVILDSQGINYNLYNDVCEVVNKEEDIIIKINLLRREFEDRVKNNTRDKMVVFIDEIYEILKLDNSVKDDINYLLEVGSTMGIYLVVSTDSVLEDDTYDLFNKDNVSKISFYLTSRGEYNMFLGKAIRDNLGKDGMYLDNDKNLIRMSIPMVEDDEIERVCMYIKDNK